jgi:hypothetical protein
MQREILFMMKNSSSTLADEREILFTMKNSYSALAAATIVFIYD